MGHCHGNETCSPEKAMLFQGSWASPYRSSETQSSLHECRRLCFAASACLIACTQNRHTAAVCGCVAKSGITPEKSTPFRVLYRQRFRADCAEFPCHKFQITAFCTMNYSCGPADTSAFPASLLSYLAKFLMKRPARSFALASHSEASA